MRQVPSRCQPDGRSGLSTNDLASRRPPRAPRRRARRQTRACARCCRSGGSAPAAPGCRARPSGPDRASTSLIALRQVLAHHAHVDHVRRTARRMPRGGLRPTARGCAVKPPDAPCAAGPDCRTTCSTKPRTKSRARIGLVELVAEDDAADRALRSCSSGSARRRATAANGWNIRFLPTMPLRFARPSGNCAERELSSRRGVPMPLHASTTSGARCSWSAPSRVVVERRRAPGHRPSTVISRTRQRVRSSTPRRERQRPVRHVGAGARAGRAADVARAAVVARRAAVVRRASGWRRPTATSASRACRSRAPSSRRAARAAAAASGAAERGGCDGSPVDARDARSSGRSGRRTARARRK